MTRRIPPLTALRAFEAAGRLVNFSRAAEELNVTPGAISRQIRLLEEYLGFHLFDRTNAKLQLTDRSADYVRGLTDAFTRIDLSTQRLLSDRHERQLKIACSMTFALRWLLPRLPLFHQEHPGLEVRLSIAPHPREFDLLDVDMAVVVNDGRRADFIFEPLFENELIAVGSPKAPLMARPDRQPCDLVGQPLLLSLLRPDDWNNWFATMKVCGYDDTFEKTELASSSLVYQAAQANLGYAIARLPLVLEDLINRSLTPLFPVIVIDPESYHMIYTKVTESANLRKFRRWLKREAATYLDRAAANLGNVRRMPLNIAHERRPAYLEPSQPR